MEQQMDKTWIVKDRDTLEYKIGVENFLIYAEENSKDPRSICIPCLCSRYGNFKKFSVKVIRGHLYENGFSLGYVKWIWHGESNTTSRSTAASNTNQAHVPNPDTTEAFDICKAAYNNSGADDYDKDSYEFKQFVADAQQPLYEGSQCSKLDSMLKLHNWRARFGISDNAFTDLLSSVGSLLPQDHVFPVNVYEAKKTLSNLSLKYVKFHAYPNECVLYSGVTENASECPKCRLSRWKLGKDGKARVNIPAKRKFMMLTVLFSGPHEPGNNIDVFLQPLIDDLKKLWEEGCVNQGYMSCPVSGDDTVAKYLSHSKNMCYQGHRRYFHRHHPYRRKKAAFNGEQDFGQPRQPLSGE
ncbi:uncharacterized protein LOC141665551 [Apium graveolens]|uniref:uncharacterized protein LOC141665551 n=1 Tax=Apium graveolens TaxID=4045 RepID=UPI003D7BE2D8